MKSWARIVASLLVYLCAIGAAQASITYPSGTLASYTHDKAGHVTAVSAEAAGSTSSVPIVSGVTYAPFGPVTRMSYGNALAETRTYDLSYRLSKLVTGTVIVARMERSVMRGGVPGMMRFLRQSPALRFASCGLRATIWMRRTGF